MLEGSDEPLEDTKLYEELGSVAGVSGRIPWHPTAVYPEGPWASYEEFCEPQRQQWVQMKHENCSQRSGLSILASVRS